MQHHTAHKLSDGSGWHYAATSRRGGRPLGYCAEHDPHATEAEARECYSRWLRDHIVFDEGTWSWSGCNAEGCDQPTRSAARVTGYDVNMATLCDQHLNAETAVKTLRLDAPAGDAWVS